MDEPTASPVVGRPRWMKDTESAKCIGCNSQFSTFVRRHHCRCCGDLFCSSCTSRVVSLPQLKYSEPVRVCNCCFDITLIRNKISPYFNQNALPPDVPQAVIQQIPKMISELSSDVHNQRKIVQQGLLPVMVALIVHPTIPIASLALVTKALVALSSNPDTQQEVGGELELLVSLLQHESPPIQCNSCAAIALLATNERIQDQVLMKVLNPLLQLLMCSANKDVQISIGMAILSLSLHPLFLERGGLSPFITLAMSGDTRLQELSLRLVENLSQSAAEFHENFLSGGGLHPFLELLSSLDTDVRLHSLRVLNQRIVKTREICEKLLEEGVLRHVTVLMSFDGTADSLLLEILKLIFNLVQHEEFKLPISGNFKLNSS
eukprot:TRINITY_DN333_c5_g1_i1.p1 TRINITY_DN333_c5_g1~~TRINITY_DN333_c5_g1_i1.p1  ORF type:complete len:406 (+),score=104.91 TRINITY_DN333_c5_g1_i1:90-1220(+)